MLSLEQIQRIRACCKDEEAFQQMVQLVAEVGQSDNALWNQQSHAASQQLAEQRTLLRRRDAILEAVGFAAEQFLQSSSFEQSIGAVLKRLGRATMVSRVYIFENADGAEMGLVTNQRYEWVAPGIEPQIDNPDLQGVPYVAAGLERWMNAMLQGQTIFGLIRDFPVGEREILEPQNILALAAVPIFVGPQWWGFIGFDDCAFERGWTAPEIETLKAAAGLMGAAIQRERVTQALHENEKRYRGLVESQVDMIVRVDSEGRFTFVNDVYCKTFGKTPDELLGHTFLPLVHEDDVEPTLEAMKGLDVPPYRIYVEQRAFTVRGWRWLAWEDYAIKDEDGRTREIQAIGRDITDRKEAEEALRQSESHYRAIVEDQTELICRTRPDGTLTFVNEAYCRYFGQPREALVGQSMLHRIPEEDLSRVRGRVQELGAEVPVVTFETRIAVSDGDLRWQQWTIRGIYDQQEAPVEFQGVGRDITDWVKAQEDLVRISTAVESASDAVSIGDMHAHALYHNRAFVELYGYTAEQLNEVGGPPAVFVDQAVAVEVVKTAIAGRSWIGTVDFCSRDGRVIPTMLRADCIHDRAGNAVGLIAVCTDVTVQKEVERELIAAREAALETSRMKSEFLANMSHEIRTPLNAIIGMTGLLLEMELGDEVREFAETIRNSGDALLMIINDILDFSKIEAGKLDLEYQPFSVRECVEESLDLLAPQAAEKGLELVHVIDEAVPPALLGDVTRVRQVLINLLSNAVKFTERGEVVVSVGGQRIGDGGAGNGGDVYADRQPSEMTASRPCYEVRFKVSDTGIGIPASRMGRLFQSFSQVDSSVTRKYGGTGLGLAISRALVEAMGGTLHVESEEGVGTTFSFTIQAPVISAPLSHAPMETLPLEGKRVLIVDDNETNRRILTRQIQSWGMLSSATDSGHEALQWIRWGQPFDVAILDMQMPEMDGITLAREIRAHRSAQVLPLMLLTSVGGLRGVDMQEVAFAASLTKPVKPSNLHNVLLNIVSGQREPDEIETLPATVAVDPFHAHPLRILVAEDHAVNQKVALRLLRRAGYRADVAANGFEVLDALQRQSYDLILMDVQMPELDGEATTQRIRAEYPTERQPRIVAVTAHALKGSRERYLAAGMDYYMSKPVRLEELTRLLQKYQREKDQRIATDAPATGERDQSPLPPAPAVSAAPAPASATEPPPLDESVLRDLLEDADEEEREELGDIIMLFLESTPDLIAELHRAVASVDPPRLRRAAHTLKSSSQVGAMPLSALSADLQAIGDAGTVEGAPALIAQIEAEYARVAAALEALQQRLVGSGDSVTEDNL